MSARTLARVLRQGSQAEICHFIQALDVDTIPLESYQFHGISRLISKYAPGNQMAEKLRDEINLREWTEYGKALDEVIEGLMGESEVTRERMTRICSTAESWKGVEGEVLREYLEHYRPFMPVFVEDPGLKLDTFEPELIALSDPTFSLEVRPPRFPLRSITTKINEPEESEDDEQLSLNYKGTRCSRAARLMPAIRRAFREGRPHPYRKNGKYY